VRRRRRPRRRGQRRRRATRRRQRWAVLQSQLSKVDPTLMAFSDPINASVHTLTILCIANYTMDLFYPAGEKGSSPSLELENLEPTAGFFQSVDWRSGDPRLIGAVAAAPMKTPLARAIRFFARRSAHTAPCF